MVNHLRDLVAEAVVVVAVVDVVVVDTEVVVEAVVDDVLNFPDALHWGIQNL